MGRRCLKHEFLDGRAVPQETHDPDDGSQAQTFRNAEKYLPLGGLVTGKKLVIIDVIIIALIAGASLFIENKAINGPLTVNYLNYHEAFAQMSSAYNQFDPKTSIQTLTENSSWQRGAVALKNPVRMDSDFVMDISVNLGDKSSKEGGADGISFFFHPGSVWELGSNGNGIGVGGIKGAFGFKLDTYFNSRKDAKKGVRKGMAYSSDPQGFKDQAFGAFINSQGVDSAGEYDSNVLNGFSQVIIRNPAPQQIPQPVSNRFRRLTFSYDSSSKDLSVVYAGKRWKRNVKDWVGSRKTLYFTVAATTGGNYFNRQQIRIKNLTFTPGR